VPACSYIRSDGNGCKARAPTGSAFCAFHDPARADQQREARRQGGKARSKRAAVLPIGTADLPLASVADVAALLADTINQVRRGEVDAKVGSCLGYLANSLLKAIEASTLAEEMAALKTEVEALKRDDRQLQTHPVQPPAGDAGPADQDGLLDGEVDGGPGPATG
jgi:hypothetical protein